jgi:archaellum component FlaC
MEVDMMDQELITILSNMLDEKLIPLKVEMEGMKVEMERIDKRLSRVEGKLDEMDHKLNLLASESPEDIKGMLSVMDKKLDAIKKDVEFTYQKTSMNELEIHRLKSQ